MYFSGTHTPRRPGPHYTVLTWSRTIFCPKLTFLIRKANDRRQCQRSKHCRSLDSLSAHYLRDQATTSRDIHLVPYKMHFPRNLTSSMNLTFTGTGIHPALRFSVELLHIAIKILVLSHQPTLLCFFSPFQDSQRSSILQWERTRYMQHIPGSCCSGKTAEQGQMGPFPEWPASSAQEKSGLWIIKHWWVFFSNALTGPQGLILLRMHRHPHPRLAQYGTTTGSTISYSASSLRRSTFSIPPSFQISWPCSGW